MPRIRLGLDRPLVGQDFRTFSVSVGVTPTALDPNSKLQDLITTFIISNPAAGVSVYMGNLGVTTATGLEILASTTPVFTIDNEGRQLYELQAPLLDISAGLKCSNMEIDGIPFVVWNLANIYLVAGGATTVSVSVYPEMFI